MTLFVIRGYIPGTSAKSGVGIGVPDRHRDLHTPRACFFCRTHEHIQIMVAQAGEPKGSPVMSRYANPVWATALKLAFLVVVIN
ncbi:hypothetical protein GNZ98_13065 [Salmonella enterica subsp. enterica]|nr:hypothetical protein [Salmonella enterica subsp. enterica serovar Madelia]